MAVLQDININVHGQPSEKRLQTFLRLSQNEDGRMINFRVLGPPLPSNCTATFSGTKPDGNVYSKTGTVAGNFVIIQEDMQMTAVAGVWDAKLDIINGSHNIMTALIRVVIDADVVDPDAIASDSQLQGLVAEAKYYAEHARTDAYGSPLTAPTKAQMTDHTRVYVYTGSETGVTAGNWYYWNGSAWVSGGVYNSVAVQSDSELNDFSTNPVQNKVIKAALDQIEGAIPEIDATLSVSGKAADAKKTGDEISSLKEDLNDTKDVVVAKDAGINIGDLVVGSTVNSVNGGNSSVNYGTRTGYVDFNVPVLIRFDFDLDTYQYDVFTYSIHSVANVVANPTNAKWANNERIFVFVPDGTAPCFRIGIKRKDMQAMTTDSADPTSDFYKIKNGIKIYRITDTELNAVGVPADSKATGDAIRNAKTISCALSVDYRTGIQDNTDYDTVVTAGNYYVGTAKNASTMTHCPTSLSHIMFVLTTINADRVIQIVQESSLTPKIYMRYYNGSTWTVWDSLFNGNDAIQLAKTLSYSLSVDLRTGIASGTDYDTLLTAGNYYVGTATNASTMTHCPTSLSHIMFVLTSINSERVIQIVQESSLTSHIYKRYYNGSTWTSWTRLITDQDVDVNRLNAHMTDSNILSSHPAGTTTTNGITVKSDGSGTYKISGTATANTVYNIYNNTSAFPSGFRAGETYRVKVDIPSLYTHFRVIYYVAGEGTKVFDSTYDGTFTLPSNAEGLTIRLFFYNNELNSPEFEVHPQIFVDDSVGYIESTGKKSFYPPMLTIIDDDGYGYYYRDLMPLCQAKNVSISSAVVTGYMGQRAGYMTWAQVQECYAAGCEILSHGYNHKTDADILQDETTAEELEKWYRMAKHDLELHGIKSDIFVFNNNTGNVIQCQQAARRVYKAAIHAAGAEINAPTANPYYIKRYNFTAGSHEEPHTLQEMKDNIDALVSAGTGWDCWMIHTSSTGGWSADEVAKLGDAIDYARSQGVLVVTCEYAMRYYYGIV